MRSPLDRLVRQPEHSPFGRPQTPTSQRPICLQIIRVFDFLPERPTSPETALRLLAGGSVKGVTRERQLRRLPRRRCFLIAESTSSQVTCNAEDRVLRHMSLQPRLRYGCMHAGM